MRNRNHDKGKLDHEVSAAVEVNRSMAMYSTIDDYVARFGERFSVGITAIADAGRIYAEALLHHPTTAYSAFSSKYPSVCRRTWDMLRAIGNGDLNPGAMLLLPRVADRVRKMTRKQQDALFNDSARGVQIVNFRDFSIDTVDVANLTVAQMSLVLDESKGRLRTIEEQREFVSKTMKNNASNVRGKVKVGAPYRVVGRTLIVGKVEIGREELKSILLQMDATGK